MSERKHLDSRLGFKRRQVRRLVSQYAEKQKRLIKFSTITKIGIAWGFIISK